MAGTSLQFFGHLPQKLKPLQHTTATAAMDNERLINTFEMLIDQLNKVSITNELLLEHAKHESRHKVNNELINSALFGYSFKIHNLGWTPTCYGGHVRFALTENPLSEVWKNMWKDPRSLTEEQAAMAAQIKAAIAPHVGDMEQFAKNMQSTDGERLSDAGICELHMTDHYDIETLHTFVDDYAYSELFKAACKNDRLSGFNLECKTATMFYSRADKEELAQQEIPIDKVIEDILPELARVGIRKEHIRAVYFTRLEGHAKDIIELYDLMNCREDCRHEMIHEIVDEMSESCKKHCKDHIVELSEKLDETEIPFMPNLFNEPEEFEHLIEILS